MSAALVCLVLMALPCRSVVVPPSTGWSEDVVCRSQGERWVVVTCPEEKR